MLARRPYDLRHGGVSLRLDAGIPATQVPNGPITVLKSYSPSTPSASRDRIGSGSSALTAGWVRNEIPGPRPVRRRLRMHAPGDTRLRRPSSQSSEFVPPTWPYAVGISVRMLDHSAHIPDHGSS